MQPHRGVNKLEYRTRNGMEIQAHFALTASQACRNWLAKRFRNAGARDRYGEWCRLAGMIWSPICTISLRLPLCPDSGLLKREVPYMGAECSGNLSRGARQRSEQMGVWHAGHLLEQTCTISLRLPLCPDTGFRKGKCLLRC